MQRDCSEETAREIDEEVKAILDEATPGRRRFWLRIATSSRKSPPNCSKKRSPRRPASFTGSSARKCRASKNPLPPLPRAPVVKL